MFVSNDNKTDRVEIFALKLTSPQSPKLKTEYLKETQFHDRGLVGLDLSIFVSKNRPQNSWTKLKLKPKKTFDF